MWSSALELRQAVIDRLTRRLSFHGWQFQTEPGFDAVFWRPVSDGYQRITARLKGDLPALSCDIVIEQGSRWFTQAMRQAGYPLGNPSALNKIFQFDLVDFRLLHSPGWLRWIDTGLVALTWSEGWLDWLLDDLESQAIPVLNKAQTMDGLYGLFLDPANAGTFPANVPQIGAADPGSFEAVLAVAFACEHRGLDALISRFDTQLKSQGSEASRFAMQRLVRALRELPRPVSVSSANE